MNTNYRVTDFVSTLRVHDEKNKIIKIKNRYSASLIFPLSGKIEFDHSGKTLCADNAHPIYIPRGIDYTNRCIETAESILFNIYDIGGYDEITYLPYLDTEKIIKYYNTLINCENYPENLKALYSLSHIYKLLFGLFAPENQSINPLIKHSVAYIKNNYYKPQLSLDDIANSVHISTVYLSKLFAKELNTTPFKYLTKTRMENAADYIREMRSIKETAKNTGYSDIYQFSRAFKRFYGCSPKEYNNNFN